MPQKLLLSIILLFSYTLAAGQTAPAKTEENEKLRKAAVEFLRETSLEVGRMGSIENRLSFSAELASLMWFHDEKEARAMYGGAVSDFKQLLMHFDSRMNSLDIASDEDASMSFLFGPAGRSPVERKLRVAMMVRQQIALSLAEHDAELAYGFFYDTASLISNPEFRKETEQADKRFEFQLMKQIAETNAERAAKYGLASLKDGVDGNHIELLKKIYAKDADKGIELGEAILSKLKSGKSSVKADHVYSSLLSYGGQNLEASKKTGGKKAIFTQNDLRDIADQFAQALLDRSEEDLDYSISGYIDQIEKFAPSRAIQIRLKFKSQTTTTSAMANAVNRVANVAISGISSGMGANANAMQNADLEAREIASKQMLEDIQKLGKPLPKEERGKIVAQSRKIISQTPGRDKKIAALSMLAAQVAKAGDKELADEIMRDAERLINPQPKNYMDFLHTWMLASGYAEANPEKAFPFLENTILRANETISAFVKVAEFIDVTEEMVSDGEVQVGVFGGSMIRGLTNDLAIANSTLISLAKADFAKTKALTNSFDRIEVRVLAKMMVLRAVLDNKKPNAVEAINVDTEF